MKMYYSQAAKGFYAEGIAFLPEDAQEIDMPDWQALLAGQAQGLSIDFEKSPPSLSIREMTPEEDKILAEQKRDLLIDDANNVMNKFQWPGKAALGRLKDSERTAYEMWLDYLDAVQELDIDTAPDIVWPTRPAEWAS